MVKLSWNLKEIGIDFHVKFLLNFANFHNHFLSVTNEVIRFVITKDVLAWRKGRSQRDRRSCEQDSTRYWQGRSTYWKKDF